MTRKLHNWSYQHVTDFLKDNGFRFFEELKGSRQAWFKLQDGGDVTDFLKENRFSFFEELKGSHQSWVKLGKKGESEKFVELNFRHDTYPVRTLKEIIRESGIPEKTWIEWAGS
jgi:hypothetical protein